MSAFSVFIAIVALIILAPAQMICYHKFRRALHEQGVLPYYFDGAKYNMHILAWWNMLDSDRKTTVTFIGAFWKIILAVIAIILIIFALLYLHALSTLQQTPL